jgi:hypothetical protein
MGRTGWRAVLLPGLIVSVAAALRIWRLDLPAVSELPGAGSARTPRT